MVTDSVTSPTFSDSFALSSSVSPKITTTPPPTTSHLNTTPPKGNRPTPQPLILLPHQQVWKEGSAGRSPVEMVGNDRGVVVQHDPSAGLAVGAVSDTSSGARRGDTVLLNPNPSFEMLVVVSLNSIP